MGRLLLMAVLALGALPAAAATPKLEAPYYRFDRATIRRGAELFARRCSVCHSVSRIRYRRLETDLDMPPGTLRDDIMLPSGARIHQGMMSAMRPRDAAKWFGMAPPDLTLEARYRGIDWIYTYLKSFYRDPKRPTGFDNRIFKNVAMPDVLEPLQGIRAEDGSVIQKGSVSPEQFDRDVAVITAWLQYTSDPSKLTREALGPWVIGFLVLFTLLAYALKRIVWRRVH
ncbi:MAG TPA: cytochrome c1 [Burkholderiales bacterium]|nr:cytochrome c1 [Burkholderiales bacterium]